MLCQLIINRHCCINFVIWQIFIAHLLLPALCDFYLLLAEYMMIYLYLSITLNSQPMNNDIVLHKSNNILGLTGCANKHGASHNISMECEKNENDKSCLKMFLYGSKDYNIKHWDKAKALKLY